MNTTHSKWNGLAVICIIGFITVAAVADIILAPFFHVTPDPSITTIITSGMIGLLGLLKSAQTAPADSPQQVEVTNSPEQAVPTKEAGTP